MHPLSVGVVGTYSRESANRVVNRADLVCFVGSETGGMTTHFWAVPKIGTPAIQIDIDAEALGRNYPLLAAVNGDAKVTLAKMLESADRAGAAKRKAWIAEAQSICGEWRDKYKSRAHLRRGADPPRAAVPRALAARARRRHRGGRHRPCRHVDGRDVRSARARSRAICAAPAISAGHFPPGSARNAARRSVRW